MPIDVWRRSSTPWIAGLPWSPRDGSVVRTNRAFDALGWVDISGRIASSEIAELLADGRGSAIGRQDLIATVTPTGDDGDSRVLTVKDVTEVRREEEEGGRRRRLEALGRMAAEVAHEIRNPLGGIRLFASMLRDDLQQQPEQCNMTEQILSATAGLETTVSNLLTFASPSGGTRRTIDIARIAREACSLLAPACAVRGVRLSGPTEDTCCELTAEPEGTRQVLLNLIGNALAATEGDGRIEVSVEMEQELVKLVVRDNGCGIAVEDLPRVFDPFFTRSEGGSGLGLSIVHGIVERHGGRIRLDSQAGHGTTAVVALPSEFQPAPEALHV